MWRRKTYWIYMYAYTCVYMCTHISCTRLPIRHNKMIDLQLLKAIKHTPSLSVYNMIRVYINIFTIITQINIKQRNSVISSIIYMSKHLDIIFILLTNIKLEVILHQYTLHYYDVVLRKA